MAKFRGVVVMAKRQKLKEKLYPEEKELKSVEAVSSDDEEANEDLSLKIVEKHLLMRAAKLDQDDDDSDEVVLNENKNDCVVDLPSSSLLETVVDVAGPREVGDDPVIRDVKSDKKESKARKKKKKVESTGVADQSVIVAEVEQKVETVENAEEAVKTAEDPNSVEISDNIVLQKLLRGPRYFDPPDISWQMCYNCGVEGHMAVNCTSALKQKKPCFICGSLEHVAKQCIKTQDCFICRKGGHRAKDCPEKHKSGSQNAQICLKCGDYGHDLFSCRNDYPLDDIKEIQCYICKSFGHLCCVKVTDMSPKEFSCYRCGLLGHTGLACTRLRVETADAPPSSCYKCGGEGHFARECASSVKVCKRNIDLSTPILRPHNENKESSGFKSAPHGLGNARKKKKIQHEERGITMPRKSKQRGGWITDDLGDVSYKQANRNRWKSPAMPSRKGYKISDVTSGVHISSSPPSKNRSSHHNFAASRFANSGSDGIRKNYNWW